MLSRALTLLSVTSRAPKTGLLTVSSRSGERLASIGVHDHLIFLVRSNLRKPRLYERLASQDPITARAFSLAVGEVKRSTRKVQGVVGILPELQLQVIREALRLEFSDEFEALAIATRGSALNLSWMPLNGHPPPSLALSASDIFWHLVERTVVPKQDQASHFYNGVRGVAEASMLISIEGSGEGEKPFPLETAGLESLRLFQLAQLTRSATHFSTQSVPKAIGQVPEVTSLTFEGGNWITVTGESHLCVSRFARPELATSALSRLVGGQSCQP